MVGILLITHAPLGRAFIEAVTHVYKDPPQRVEALDVITDQDPAEVLSIARDAIKRINDGSGVLVLTDVLGATPANCTQSLCIPGEIEVIAGVSLPMLLRAIGYRNNTLETLTEMALTGGQKGVCRVAGKT